MVNEKEPIKIISAKIPTSLHAECEEMRDDLRMGSTNEFVKRALIFYLRACRHANEQDRESGHTKEVK